MSMLRPPNLGRHQQITCLIQSEGRQPQHTGVEVVVEGSVHETTLLLVYFQCFERLR